MTTITQDWARVRAYAEVLEVSDKAIKLAFSADSRDDTWIPLSAYQDEHTPGAALPAQYVRTWIVRRARLQPFVL